MTARGATQLLADIADVGRDVRRGGYSRHAFDGSELELRTWFAEQAGRRGLDVETDRNGNMWAWWGQAGPDAVVTGSHLDSVPGGGAFDGPLGITSAFAAVDRLVAQGFRPRTPLAVVAFVEEEGGRFGVPCLGSRLLTGATAPADAVRLRDPDGITFADAAAAAGLDPSRLGRDDERLSRIGRFVELHVEQGRALGPLERPLALATSIVAHGRWRFTVAGRGNHAGTTKVTDRHDPMIPAASAVLAARDAASGTGGGAATIGRIVPNPGGTNVIPSTVDFWLDARVDGGDATKRLVDDVTDAVSRSATAEGCTVSVSRESFGDTVSFDGQLRDQLDDVLGDVPLLATGAGHDAGILAARVPTAMLFVRNPTGVSHAPEEYAESADCEAGAQALARVLESLAG